MQKIIKPVSGFLILILSLAGIAGGIYLIVTATRNGTTDLTLLWAGIVLLLLSLFFSGGLIVINPNQSSVCTFFGKYAGTIKENGLLFVNPFY